MMHGNDITWQSLYDLEIRMDEAIGGKERFIIISNMVRNATFSKKSVRILDGGGTRVTSMILKEMYPDSFLVSVNIEGVNNIADVAITADLTDCDIIPDVSGCSEFDIIFLGEVFEHLIKPYPTLKKLAKLLNNGGYVIITTPNIANIYNRLLLLFGEPLYNYRPLGMLPSDDHITLVTKQQMIRLLRLELNLDIYQVKGYSYYEKEIGIQPESPFARSGIRLRHLRSIVNKILPTNFKEGLVYVARRRLSN